MSKNSQPLTIKRIFYGTTKGEMMKIAYCGNEEKLRNVDASIPLEYQKELKNCFWYVMDYNNNKIFGELRDLKDVARENGLELKF